MTIPSLAAMTAAERSERADVASPVRPARVEGTDAFAATLAAREKPAASISTDVGFRHQTSRSAELEPLKKFESFVLRSFIETMLPSESSGFFGTGTAANIWRSMLAERIGDEMAASGGIGIADMLEKSRVEATSASAKAEETN